MPSGFSRSKLTIALVCALWASAALAHNTLTQAERDAGWQLLFDGATTAGWRTYRTDHVTDGWQVLEGNLSLVERGGDLVTIEQFANFDLQLEWRVAAGGNSGVFIRAGESEPYIFMSAPEVQILDDAGHRDGKQVLTSAGSNYGLHPVPRGVVKPAGVWNHSRIRIVGNAVTQWLNGVQVVNYVLASADWKQRVASSKFAQWPAYGSLTTGHIGLQDHGDKVDFRNIKIKVLSQ